MEREGERERERERERESESERARERERESTCGNWIGGSLGRVECRSLVITGIRSTHT